MLRWGSHNVGWSGLKFKTFLLWFPKYWAGAPSGICHSEPRTHSLQARALPLSYTQALSTAFFSALCSFVFISLHPIPSLACQMDPSKQVFVIWEVIFLSTVKHNSSCGQQERSYTQFLLKRAMRSCSNPLKWPWLSGSCEQTQGTCTELQRLSSIGQKHRTALENCYLKKDSCMCVDSYRCAPVCTEAKENTRLSELELQVFGGGLDCRMGARFWNPVFMTVLWLLSHISSPNSNPWQAWGLEFASSAHKRKLGSQTQGIPGTNWLPVLTSIGQLWIYQELLPQ